MHVNAHVPMRVRDWYNTSKRFDTHHEGLEVRPPPLRETVTNFPLVVHSVRRVELPRIRWWREALVQTLLQTLDLVLARLQVVSRSAADRVRTR